MDTFRWIRLAQTISMDTPSGNNGHLAETMSNVIVSGYTLGTTMDTPMEDNGYNLGKI